MKKSKIIVFAVILTLAYSGVFARDYIVRTWAELSSNYNSVVDGDYISVAQDIVFASGLGSPAAWTDIAIRSNNNTIRYLDGNKGAFQGFSLTSKALTFSNIGVTKFYAAANGGVIAANASTITFNGLNINFTSNTAANGGGIYAVNSRIDFNKSDRRANLNISIAYNSAGSGGFANVSLSTLSFSETIAAFSSNTATNGAGIYANNSIVNLSNSSAAFMANQGNYGVAFYIPNSKLNLDSVKVYVMSNIVKTNNGGSIYANGVQSKITLNNSLLDVRGNMATAWTSGIMLIASSIFSVSDSEVNFTSNTATGLTSLAINNASATFRNSHINFIRNTAAYANNYAIGYGAPALIVWNNLNSNANFIDSRVAFTSNSALGASVGGAVSFGDYGGKILFENSIATFTHNVSQFGFGGAIALYGGGGSARLDFMGGRAAFIDNSAVGNSTVTANYGGAIADSLALSVSVNFSSMASAYFIHNIATSSGGAITLLSRSTTSFYSSTISFTANTAISAVSGHGGAIYMSESRLSFLKSAVNFSNNISSASGGAIYAKDDLSISLLDLSSSNISFISNSAKGDGGALFLQYVRSDYINSILTFENNISQSRGGAIYILTARTRFADSDLNFINNVSLSSGGAVFLDGEMRNLGKNVLFSFVGNTAYAGGALYFKGYEMEFPNIIAKDNIASSSGGAIYLEGGDDIRRTLFTISALDRDVLFDNNKMANGAILNDIFISDRIELLFNAAKDRRIDLNSGIRSQMQSADPNYNKIGIDSIVIKIGEGEMSLAASDFRGQVLIDEGLFSISSNSAIAARGIQYSTFTRFEINGNAKFSTVNNFKDRVNILDLFVVKGSLELEINYDKDENDLITADEVWLSTFSILGLKSVGGGSNKIVVGSSVPLIFANLKLTNHFQNDRITDRRVIYDIITTTKVTGAEIWIRADEIVDFQYYAKTDNQRAVSPSMEHYIDSGRTNRITETLMFYAANRDYDGFLSVLDAAHGQIYANVLRTGARSVGLNSLYERIMPQYGAPAANLWFELYGAGGEISATKGSFGGDFKSTVFGFRAGGELFSDESKTAGIYVRYGANDFKEGIDKASVGDVEIGVYGALFDINNIDIKGNLSGGFQTYDISRDVLGYNPKSDFNTLSLRAGVEADYIRFVLQNRFIFMPFLALNGGFTTNPNIVELNGQEAELIISNNSYFRLETLIGAGFYSNNAKKFNWGAKLYGKIVAAGSEPEYTAQLRNMDISDFKIKGYEEDIFSIGAALNAQYQFNSKISARLDLSGEVGSQTKGYFIGAVFNYRLGIKGAQSKESDAASLRKEPAKQPSKIVDEDGWRFVDESIDVEIDFRVENEQEEEPLIVELETKSKPSPISDLSQAKNRRANSIITFQLLAAVFDANSYTLSDISKRSIKEIANQIKKIPSYRMITVEGHTDTIGDNSDNDILSSRRAQAVSEELARNGIDTNKIRFVGMGSRIQIRSDATLLGRQANRRVEIYVE
ncbi:MAG: OmpA family protein [Elusimicrobiota bacterium]|jgi:predicted outer membrane repeat protein|nr:OmpA family protein [Elusimicrobiota bacterium]